MAVANLASIAAALRAGGLPRTTPALIVHAATTEAEAVLDATLDTLPRLAAERAVLSPAIVVIGAIAAFRAQIVDHLLPHAADVRAARNPRPGPPRERAPSPASSSRRRAPAPARPP